MSTRWITWGTASELTGLRVPTIEHAVRVNRIRHRPRRGVRPTLDAASVEEWAAWYRNLQEQQKLSAQRARSTPESLPPGEWLSAAEAAQVLDVTAATVRRRADIGHLETHRGVQLWVNQESVRALAAERDRWISWSTAAEILGCARELIPRLVEDGHLEKRPGHRTTASMSRASVEAYAPVFAQERADAQRRQAELEQALSVRTRGPADGDVWLDVGTTALMLALSGSRITQMIHSELLPATQVGRRWWLRRRDVEQAAAARVFYKHTTTRQLRA